IGLSVVQGAVMAGAGRIIGIDANPKKFPLARQLGATDVVDVSGIDNVAEAVMEMTDGGVDFAFECIGNVEVMNQALMSCHKGWGQYIIIGVAGAGEEIHVRRFLLVTGRVWRGTAFGGTRGRTQLPQYVDWYMERRIKLDGLVTHTLQLQAHSRAFELMHAGESIRSVIQFQER